MRLSPRAHCTNLPKTRRTPPARFDAKRGTCTGRGHGRHRRRGTADRIRCVAPAGAKYPGSQNAPDSAGEVRRETDRRVRRGRRADGRGSAPTTHSGGTSRQTQTRRRAKPDQRPRGDADANPIELHPEHTHAPTQAIEIRCKTAASVAGRNDSPKRNSTNRTGGPARADQLTRSRLPLNGQLTERDQSGVDREPAATDATEKWAPVLDHILAPSPKDHKTSELWSHFHGKGPSKGRKLLCWRDVRGATMWSHFRDIRTTFRVQNRTTIQTQYPLESPPNAFYTIAAAELWSGPHLADLLPQTRGH